jgi:simple sugar transport system ATP-binding protein
MLEDRHAAHWSWVQLAWESAVLRYDRVHASAGWTNHGRMRQATAQMMERFDVRPGIRLLSRILRRYPLKVVLAREVGTTPKVLLVGQPTRGDIGAIEFIYSQLRAVC